jgi:hypothetical protein
MKNEDLSICKLAIITMNKQVSFTDQKINRNVNKTSY